ncbi:conserved hypothetical protein [Neospora caninum Liverpool]|uniref:Zinc finger domain, LSD1 subclass domain-containing protein n=1 Tax=Neospora caninum (strain Liverpool) TaxID=572307 RepID=F0VQP9_NEOCL|nr:conserved hypothetical protein [Neospora caninum Liverpool]CBZ56046.1 conserved hypothetical protein [Neospora caninum Liverpool]CEL70794.1 TPA: hypothetical protein BN1204_064720 [Neospora caninum Liverpool]|eukprot:XP_003886072.1 conserved hypothetical protein [Neospora caninum Liverpool]
MSPRTALSCQLFLALPPGNGSSPHSRQDRDPHAEPYHKMAEKPGEGSSDARAWTGVESSLARENPDDDFLCALAAGSLESASLPSLSCRHLQNATKDASRLDTSGCDARSLASSRSSLRLDPVTTLQKRGTENEKRQREVQAGVRRGREAHEEEERQDIGKEEREAHEEEEREDIGKEEREAHEEEEREAHEEEEREEIGEEEREDIGKEEALSEKSSLGVETNAELEADASAGPPRIRCRRCAQLMEFDPGSRFVQCYQCAAINRVLPRGDDGVHAGGEVLALICPSCLTTNLAPRDKLIVRCGVCGTLSVVPSADRLVCEAPGERGVRTAEARLPE